MGDIHRGQGTPVDTRPLPPASRPVVLRLRAREEAEKQGYDYKQFFFRCVQYGTIYDSALRAIWQKGGDFEQLGLRTVAILCQALGALATPPPNIVGDPARHGDTNVYLFWYEPSGLGDYPRTDTALSDDE
jgi:hypothetical protein